MKKHGSRCLENIHLGVKMVDHYESVPEIDLEEDNFGVQTKVTEIRSHRESKPGSRLLCKTQRTTLEFICKNYCVAVLELTIPPYVFRIRVGKNSKT